MTYKNIKFTDSPTMRSLEKLAVSKGLVKSEQIQKTASSVEVKSTLKPTDNVEENILKLCSALRSSGFSKHATEVETNFFNLKKAQAYDVHGETGEDVINFAHPDGSHQMKNVDGDAMFETIIDQQTAMKKMIAKKPTGKLASKALADMVKAAGRLEKKHAIDAVKIILAKDLINIDEDNGDTGTTSTLSSIAHQANFVLWQETVQKIEKQITTLMNLDKIPPQIKQAVNTYKQFISNISIALSTALNDANKKAKELETKRLLASGNDHSAARINIKEILPYLSEGKAANLGLGSVATFGELKSKLSELYSQIGNALQTKLFPAFNQAPFDSGDLKNVGDKIKQALTESIETLKRDNMSNVKNAQKSPQGLDLKGLPDFSTPSAPVKLNQPKIEPSPDSKGGLNSFMPASTTSEYKPTTVLNSFMPNAPATHKNVNYGSSAVKEMQKAILNFGNVASSIDVTNLNNDQGRTEGPNKEYLGGSDPFGNFIVDQYLNEADPVGHQYLNVDIHGNANRENKGSTPNKGLKGVIDTIKRIGSPGTQGTEKAADGIWQVRTNNALKNIFAICYGMLHFAKDMNLDTNSLGLSDKTLDEFKNLIPSDYTKIAANEKDEVAKKLTNIINQMTNVFTSFKQFVLNNNKYKSYIDQKKSFKQYSKSNNVDPTSSLNDSEKQYISSGKSVQAIPGIKFQNVKNESQNYLTLEDVSSADNFYSMMSRLGRDPKNQQDVKNTITEVNSLLNDVPVAGV